MHGGLPIEPRRRLFYRTGDDDDLALTVRRHKKAIFYRTRLMTSLRKCYKHHHDIVNSLCLMSMFVSRLTRELIVVPVDLFRMTCNPCNRSRRCTLFQSTWSCVCDLVCPSIWAGVTKTTSASTCKVSVEMCVADGNAEPWTKQIITE